MRKLSLTSLAFAIAVSGRSSPAQDRPPSRELWFYLSTNLLVDGNLTKLESVFRRAAKAGYTAVLLADSKFSRLADMDERYFRNVERVKMLAGELRLEVVPALFPVGYSEGLLSRDPPATTMPIPSERGIGSRLPRA